jgi:hypothetical protein
LRKRCDGAVKRRGEKKRGKEEGKRRGEEKRGDIAGDKRGNIAGLLRALNGDIECGQYVITAGREANAE